MPPARTARLLTAEILSIGTELTVGDTRDTNAGELAGGLTGLGVAVGRLSAVPDDLDIVTSAFEAAISRADLVISTGGLGPTPDDLTREAIAAACRETPVVDTELEAWLRELWNRRGMPFPELNLKQAWLITSASALPNPNGTAPGWFVPRPDGRVIVALPGPPREMRPMWADHALPLLRERGLGSEMAARTYRLTGIGESQVAERLGEALLRATNPIVATYARVEAVDVRISATAEPPKTAEQLVDEAATTVLDLLGDNIWSTGETTWSEAIGARLDELHWTLSAVEIGTAGSFNALLGDAVWFRFDETIGLDAPAARAHEAPAMPGADTISTADQVADHDDLDHDDLFRFARRARDLGGSEVGVAIRARTRTGDTAVSIAISTPTGEHRVRRIVFLTGPLGRSRSALAAAAFVLETLKIGGDPMRTLSFDLSSTAFHDGDAIPKRFTCDGEDVSPDLTWSGAPDGTQALALIVTDPDAQDFVHWLVYDVAGTPSGGLPAGVSSSPDAPAQGTNGFGRLGYGGPCPPSGIHRYRFTLYALDQALELTGAPRIDELQAAMNGHISGEATITGTYHR